VIVIDEARGERTRRYELRVKGVTGTFCAEYFAVDVVETAPEKSLIEWSIRMPNGHERSLSTEEYSGGLLDLATLQHAFRHGAATAVGWGVTFRDIVPVEGMKEAVDDIAGSLEQLRRKLQDVESDASELPAAARTALDDAVRMAESLPIRVAALQGMVTRVKPVTDPRGRHG
jgi:hypothetical protein